jgi:ketosteroid isomerase-like protein
MTDGDQQSVDELAELILRGEVFRGGTILDGPMGIDQMADVLREMAHPDFVTVMVAESGPPLESSGVEGFKELLNDWISPYQRFRLEVEDVLAKDDKLVFLARQVATTRHGGVEVTTESASVWWQKEGLISQAAFYLDRRAGLRAAGIDADRPKAD